MRPYGSAKTLETRRRRVLTRLAQGLSLSEGARRVHVTVASVSRWPPAWRDGGAIALAAKPVPGRPRRLSAQQREHLLQLFLQGARASGVSNALWTLKRIAPVRRLACGVRSHPTHVWKGLRRCGWSCQVPERRAVHRDDHALAHGQRYQWPALKTSPTTWGPSGLPG
jgi:transposase